MVATAFESYDSYKLKSCTFVLDKMATQLSISCLCSYLHLFPSVSETRAAKRGTTKIFRTSTTSMAPGQAEGFMVSVNSYYQVLVYEVYQAPTRISKL